MCSGAFVLFYVIFLAIQLEGRGPGVGAWRRERDTRYMIPTCHTAPYSCRMVRWPFARVSTPVRGICLAKYFVSRWKTARASPSPRSSNWQRASLVPLGFPSRCAAYSECYLVAFASKDKSPGGSRERFSTLHPFKAISFQMAAKFRSILRSSSVPCRKIMISSRHVAKCLHHMTTCTVCVGCALAGMSFGISVVPFAWIQEEQDDPEGLLGCIQSKCGSSSRDLLLVLDGCPPYFTNEKK